MIPIIGFPSVVVEFAGLFRQVFSCNQMKRLEQYLSGLITGRKPTIGSIASPRQGSIGADCIEEWSPTRSSKRSTKKHSRTCSRTSSSGSTR